MDEWQYRVVKSKEGTFSIQEVYFDEDGKPYAHTIDLIVEGDTLGDLGPRLQDMMNSLKLPTVDEIEVPLEDGGNNMGAVTNENTTYIYESPDGGETIYRRRGSSSVREKKEYTDEEVETWKKNALSRSGI